MLRPANTREYRGHGALRLFSDACPVLNVFLLTRLIFWRYLTYSAGVLKRLVVSRLERFDRTFTSPLATLDRDVLLVVYHNVSGRQPWAADLHLPEQIMCHLGDADCTSRPNCLVPCRSFSSASSVGTKYLPWQMERRATTSSRHTC